MNDLDEELPRQFEGAQVLTSLLALTDTLADVEDIAEAFRQAIAANAPAHVVINALWEDEPRFESPAQAQRLFSNLLGLYDALAEGQAVNLALPMGKPAKRPKAPPPEPFTDQPTEAFVEAAWRHLDDHPKERERLTHAFENKQDALLQWLEMENLADDAYGLTRQLALDVFAFLELGGHPVPANVAPATSAEGLPSSFVEWIEEVVAEATSADEAPLPESDGVRVKRLASLAASALWAAKK